VTDDGSGPTRLVNVANPTRLLVAEWEPLVNKPFARQSNDTSPNHQALSPSDGGTSTEEGALALSGPRKLRR